MSKQFILVILATSIFSFKSFAGREDFNRPSEGLKEAVAAAATKLGYDLSTEEGRKSFGDYLKTEREKAAATAGFDLSTEEGRKKYQESVKTHVESVAAAQGFDLSTKEGKEALQKYLATSGDLVSLKQPRPPRDHDDKDKKGPKDEVAKNASSSEPQIGPPKDAARGQFNSRGHDKDPQNTGSVSAPTAANGTMEAPQARDTASTNSQPPARNQGQRPAPRH